MKPVGACSRVSAAGTFGACVRRPRVKRLPVRSFDDVAQENVVEGCVRETLGAAVAMHQAQHAADEGIARELSTIAEDELRHAALSWAIAAWSVPKMSPRKRAKLGRGCLELLDKLVRGAASPDAESRRVAGLPSETVVRSVAAALRRELSALLDA